MLERLRNAGIDVAPFQSFTWPSANSPAQDQYPAWIRTTNGFCARVTHEEDWALMGALAAKRNDGSPMLLQPCFDDRVYSALGRRQDRYFELLSVLQTVCSEGHYRVPMQHTAPSGLDDAAFHLLLANIHKVGETLPEGRYGVELEYILRDDTPLLTFVQVKSALPPAQAALLRSVQGIDPRQPMPAPKPHSAPAAVGWIPYRSGVVKEVAGVDAARDLPGVVEVAMNVQTGITLGHIVDLETRDRGGYVVAVGDTPDEAQDRMRQAVARIQIVTRVML